MKHKITITLIIFFSYFSIMCQKQNSLNLIPYPNNATIDEKNTLDFTKTINSVYWNKHNIFLQEALNRMIKDNNLKPLSVVSKSTNKNTLLITIDKEDTKSESYVLNVHPEYIELKGSVKGCYWGLQTLTQLILFSKKDKQNNIILPCVKIEDEPQFRYRGLHLDVSRHFFSVDEVKKIIDIMSFFKFNVFHWHLTDDQGWRIEIKKYPKLTSVASARRETMIEKRFPPNNYRGDGIPYGPYFYTQEQIKDVVKYATQRNIDILPEIEMPGHSSAVIYAYPELGYDWDTTIKEVPTYWGIFDEGVLNVGKENIFTFLQDVIDEVVELFPYDYIHIGGDEAPKDRWEKDSLCQLRMKQENLKNETQLQNYLTARMEKYINSKGKKIIGWDEILEGKIEPTATIMSWRGEKGGIEAANEKHEVIMTPTTYLYLDYYQSKNSIEPLAIGGLNTLEMVYNYHPIPKEILPENRKYILGAQANLWTEYIASNEHLEYMYFPRSIALSEVVWTKKELKNYDNFLKRLSTIASYLEAKNVTYRKW